MSDHPLLPLSDDTAAVWALAADPRVYRIEEAVGDGRADWWTTKGKAIAEGDRIVIWKLGGGETRRGVVALGRVTGPAEQHVDDENPYWSGDGGAELDWRVPVEYEVPESFPIWVDDPVRGRLARALSVARARGGTVFRVTEAQYDALREAPEPRSHPQPGDRWTDEELQAAVEAYVGMAVSEAAGEPVVKAEVRRALMAGPLAARTGASVEYRMRNITTVARALGAPAVSGYLPAEHVGPEAFTTIGSTLVGLLPELVAPTADPDVLASRVRVAEVAIGDDPPAGNRAPQKTSAPSTTYVRDPQVVAWVLKASGGRCEACGNAAPFQNIRGEPFLEVHHVWPLGEGGPDTTDNAAAVCPNCHRASHLADDRGEREARLRHRVSRLTARMP